MKAKKFTKETIKQIGTFERGFPKFKAGDTIVVSQRIKEGDKERLQLFQGDVICFKKNGIATSFTVRKIGANSVSVERIFPYFSPRIDSIKLVRTGKVRRAKLYYVRKKVGKAARLKEMILTKEEKIKVDNVNNRLKEDNITT